MQRHQARRRLLQELMRVSLSLRTNVLVLALLALALVPSSALATSITGTAVTAPAAAGATFESITDLSGVPGPNPPLVMTASGTATGQAATDTVDLWCTFADEGMPTFWQVATNVATDDATGAWSVTGNFIGVARQACVLRAVPSGTLATDPLSAFTGPTMLLTFWYPIKATVGPATGQAYDYYWEGSRSKGYNDFQSPSSCGYCDGNLNSPDAGSVWNRSQFVFYANQLFAENVAPFAVGRQALLIDSINALDPDDADNTLPGFQALQVAASRSAAGIDTIVETVPFVRCAPDPAYASVGASCTSLVALPVKLLRTWTISADGLTVENEDIFTATDGAAHNIDLVQAQWMKKTTPGMTMSWPQIAAGAFQPLTVLTNFAVPTTTPSSVILKQKNEGSSNNPYGSITFGNPINEIGASTEAQRFNEHALLTVPAGPGQLVMRHGYSMALTEADTRASAANFENRLVAPAVTITTPAASAAVTSNAPVTVSGTATDNVAVASLKVNGATVPVAPGGAWTTTVVPTTGANTVTAVATDAAGASATATRSFTWTDRTVPVVVRTLARKFRLALVLRKGFAGSVSSTESGTATIVLTMPRRTHAKAAKLVALGTVRVKLVAGVKQAWVVKLTKAGKRRLNATHGGKVTATLTVVDAAGNKVVTRSTTTVR